MKIVHLTTAHSANDIRIFHKQCCSLVEAGYDVILICPDIARKRCKGVYIDPIPVPKNRKERMTRTVHHACLVALNHKAHLYHFHDPELIRIAGELKKEGAKVVYDSHEDVRAQLRTKGWLPKWSRTIISHGFGILEDYAAAKTLNAIVAATPHIAKRFPSNKTVIVNNYPLKEEIINYGVTGIYHEPIIIYVGGISRIRGAIEMVRAMKILKESYCQNIRLTLIGNMSPPSLKEGLSSRPGWECVDYLGWQPRDKALGYVRRSKVGLVLFHPAPNHIYSQPNKLFEYMACGIPVVASHFPYWKDIVEGIGCGLLVDPQNSQEIAGAIQWLLEHPNEAEEMGRRGREAVMYKYNWESQIPILLGLYEQLLS